MEPLRTLSGEPVSKAALGTWGLGGAYRIGNQEAGIPTLADQDPVAVVRHALDHGVNLLDCSAAYGRAETVVGKAVRGCRSRVFIASKCGLKNDGTRSSTVDFLQCSLAASLAAMGIETLDLFQAALGPGDSVAPALEAIVCLKRQGLTRCGGLSVADPQQVEQAVSSGICDVVQLPFNLLDTRCWSSAVKAATACVAVLIKSPLNKGVLSNSDLGESLAPDDSRRLYLNDEVVNIRRGAAGAILAQAGLDNGLLEEIAIGFALAAPFATAVLFGGRRLDQVDRFLQVARQRPMPHQLYTALRMASQRIWPQVAPTFLK